MLKHKGCTALRVKLSFVLGARRFRGELSHMLTCWWVEFGEQLNHPATQLLAGKRTSGQRSRSRTHLCLLRSPSLLLLLLLLLSLLVRRLSRSLSLSLSRSLRSLCSLLRLLSCLSLPSYRSRSRLRSRSCGRRDSRHGGNQVRQYD